MSTFERKAWAVAGVILLVWGIVYFLFFLFFTGPVVR